MRFYMVPCFNKQTRERTKDLLHFRSTLVCKYELSTMMKAVLLQTCYHPILDREDNP